MARSNPAYALEHISVLVLDEKLHMRHLIRKILLALSIRDTSLVSNVPKPLKSFDILRQASSPPTDIWNPSIDLDL